MSIYTVYLRQPYGNDLRNDPFWEFGSFGLTGCHRKNLLHPRNTPLATGDRLAFLQGGSSEVRITGLTPPIELGGSSGVVEVRWDSDYRPVPYDQAPLFVDNSGLSDFPSLAAVLAGVRTRTHCGAAASKFRSRTTLVEKNLAAEIEAWFDAPDRPASTSYIEAVCTAQGPWRINAEKRGWDQPQARETQYQSLKRFGADAVSGNDEPIVIAEAPAQQPDEHAIVAPSVRNIPPKTQKGCR